MPITIDKGNRARTLFKARASARLDEIGALIAGLPTGGEAFSVATDSGNANSPADSVLEARQAVTDQLAAINTKISALRKDLKTAWTF